MDIIDPNKYYPLGEGDDERSIPMLRQVSLGSQYDRTFGTLRQLHESIRDHPQGAPTRALIESGWLLWCYVSNEVESLKTRIEALEKQIENLSARTINGEGS